jgi:hypothetical protein
VEDGELLGVVAKGEVGLGKEPLAGAVLGNADEAGLVAVGV